MRGCRPGLPRPRAAPGATRPERLCGRSRASASRRDRWVTGPRSSGGGPGSCPGQGGCWPSSDSRCMPALRPGSVRAAPGVPASLPAGAPPAANPGADQRAGALAFCPVPGRIYWGETRGYPRSSPSLSVSPRQLTNIILSYIFKYLAKSKGKKPAFISLSQARERPGGLCCPLA